MQGSSGDTGIEKSLVGTIGEGEDGMNGESSTETMYITMCKTESQWGFAVCPRELKLELHDNLEGWDGVGGRFKTEGTYVYLWLIHADARQKPIQYCKAVILQLKRKKLEKTSRKSKNKKVYIE